jgi:hypothetical protein
MEERTLKLTTEEVAFLLNVLGRVDYDTRAELEQIKKLVENIKFQTGKPKGF